jgi:rRNA maturation endonuclease Nob1
MEKNRQTLSEAEIELLKEALKRSYKEHFEMATRLYKIQQTMSKASIVHKPFINK